MLANIKVLSSTQNLMITKQKGFAVTREDSGLSGALVLTLESTQISACSYGSFVCKGKFTGMFALLDVLNLISIKTCIAHCLIKDTYFAY